MIHRDPNGFARERFDLIIIGGGVQGSTLALEAAVRGFRPLLLERDDFGRGTSGSVLGILHGGFRYLQGADLVRFRESVRAQRWWMEGFPELVEPLPSLLPLYGRALQRPVILRAALKANDFLRGRLRGDPGGATLPPGRLLSVEETLEAAPDLSEAGLEGGALWYDAWMVSPQRLIIETLRRACSLGARALNHMEVTGLRTGGGRLEGVEARDRIGGGRHVFRAPIVVNCAGPWIDDLSGRGSGPGSRLFHPSLAFNLLLDHSPPSHLALAIPGPHASDPVHFLCPFRGALLAGTVHAPWTPGRPPPESAPARLVEEFLTTLTHALPSLELSPERVRAHLTGLLPARAPGSDRTRARPTVSDHGAGGGPRGFFSVSPVKFTTAPSLSRRLVRRILPRGESRSGPRGGPLPPVRPWRSLEAFQALAERDPGRARGLVEEMVQEESVIHLEDLLLGRLDWGLEPGGFEEGRRVLERLPELLLPAPRSDP